MSEEALQIVEKRREAKGKGGKGKIHPSDCRVPKNRKESKQNVNKSSPQFTVLLL